MTQEEITPVRYTNPEISNEARGAVVDLKFGFGPMPRDLANKKIFFFDIDNCLYKRSTKIHDLMQVKIHEYFKTHLALTDEEAHQLHMNYYKTYGLALEGLVRNHHVDALEYNAKVDDLLALQSVLSYNQDLRSMLLEIKKNFDYFWLVTNAYKNHGLRVISLLGLGDLFDGLTYCDYSKNPIICKPMKAYFDNFLSLTNIHEPSTLSFVDDSEINCKAAHDLGFGRVYHYVELESEYQKLILSSDFASYYGAGDGTDPTKIIIIRDILELRSAIERVEKA